MKNTVSVPDANLTCSSKNEELSDIIEDLELSLNINKGLFKDIISSKKSSKNQNSESSDANFLISSKSLDIIQLENNRLSDAINRMTGEIVQAETQMLISKERDKQSRARRKEINSKHQKTLKELKETVQSKEEEIRKLEKYCTNIEDLLNNSLKKDAINPEYVINEGKKLITKVTKQLRAAESTRELEEKKCRDLENEINKIKSSVKVGTPILISTDQILKKNYLLNLNYENFWFVGIASHHEISDSIRSSASSVQDQQFPNKFEFSSKVKPKVPKLKFPIPNSPQDAVKDTPESKLSRLELAYQIKCEETQSLIRILNDLQAIEHSLVKGLELNNE